MEKIDKPIIGQEFYLVDIGNNARGGRGRQRPCKVSHVGRKYFTVISGEFNREVTFHLNPVVEKTNYCRNHALFNSKEEYIDSISKRKWVDKFRESFAYGGGDITLEQYKAAGEILGLSIETDIETDVK